MKTVSIHSLQVLTNKINHFWHWN